MFFNRGPVVRLPSQLPGAGDTDRLQFETDSCGILTAVRNGGAMLRQSALDQDMDELDDPSAEGQTLISRWLSMHPEIGVMSLGIDKSCDDPPLADEDVSPDSQAEWRTQEAPRTTSWTERKEAPYIA